MLSRPERNEYADFYANYVSLVPEGPVEEFLLKQWDELVDFMQGVSEDEASKPYAPGKWSAKEVLGHLCDAERVMSYRMIRFARGDQKELQGFEQDDYVAAGDFNGRVRHALIFDEGQQGCSDNDGDEPLAYGLLLEDGDGLLRGCCNPKR